MSCELTAAARTSALDGAMFSKVQAIVIQGLTVAASQSQQPQHVATAQLRQLAKLPSLSAVELHDSSCPTLFLVALGTQLTRLQLERPYRQPTQNVTTPAWRATLEHAARCTRLQELHVLCATAEELRLVAPALQRVRTLKLTCGGAANADGDAVLDVLLTGAPHLTRLVMRGALDHAFRRWHNARPCPWRELVLQGLTTQALARLPLRSLTRPVRWNLLAVPHGASLVESRAAVANAAQPGRCPAGFRWEGATDEPWCSLIMDAADADVAAHLRALRPLFAALVNLRVFRGRGAWDAEGVAALGQVLPRACADLQLCGGGVAAGALERVAAGCLPGVRHLWLTRLAARPADVVGMVRQVRERRLRAALGGGQEEGQEEGEAMARRVELRAVVVAQPQSTVGEEGAAGGSEDKEQRRSSLRAAWAEAEKEVARLEGAGVALRVMW